MIDAPRTTEIHATEDIGLCCSECLDTLTPDQKCLNVSCLAAATVATPKDAAAAARKFERGEITGPMFQPRAWTLGGRVD